MEQSGLARWSVDELTVLYTLQAGVAGHYGLRCVASWCDLIVCLFPHQHPTRCRARRVLSTGSVATMCVFCVRVLA